MFVILHGWYKKKYIKFKSFYILFSGITPYTITITLIFSILHIQNNIIQFCREKSLDIHTKFFKVY